MDTAKFINSVRRITDDDWLQDWVLDWLESFGPESRYIGDGVIRVIEAQYVVVDVDQEVYDYVDEDGEDHERVRNIPIYGWEDVLVKKRVIPESEKELIKRLDRAMGICPEPSPVRDQEEESYW